jgi:hypothetical protein
MVVLLETFILQIGISEDDNVMKKGTVQYSTNQKIPFHSLNKV